MQFLFGMLMVEMVVKLVMAWVRMVMWLGKFMLHVSWHGTQAALRGLRAQVEQHRAARAAAEKRSGL